MPIWRHTDEDGDEVWLAQRAEPGSYVMHTQDTDGNHTLVIVSEDALFRLRDEIERIATS